MPEHDLNSKLQVNHTISWSNNGSTDYRAASISCNTIYPDVTVAENNLESDLRTTR